MQNQQIFYIFILYLQIHPFHLQLFVLENINLHRWRSMVISDFLLLCYQIRNGVFNEMAVLKGLYKTMHLLLFSALQAFFPQTYRFYSKCGYIVLFEGTVQSILYYFWENRIK